MARASFHEEQRILVYFCVSEWMQKRKKDHAFLERIRVLGVHIDMHSFAYLCTMHTYLLYCLCLYHIAYVCIVQSSA